MTDVWTILERSTPIEHRWVTVYQDRCRTPSGTAVEDYFTVMKPDYAQMVAVTPEGCLLLVKQYKHGAKKSGIKRGRPSSGPGTDDDDFFRHRALLSRESRT